MIPDRLRPDDRGQMGGPDLPGVILMIGLSVIIGFIVLYLTSEIMGFTQLSAGTNTTDPDPLYNASQSLTDATNSVYGMFGLLFTIVILSVAVVYLYAIRGRR